MSSYYLLAGTNQGDRIKNLKTALEKISSHPIKIHEISSVYETEAWGLEDQPHFLNQAFRVTTDIQPLDLLSILKTIEKDMGRETTEKWGPRIMDIDILYADDFILNHPSLTIPHPGIYDRNFVLLPLIEIAGEWVDPVKNITIDEIYDLCPDTKEVYLFDEEE